MCQRQVDVKIHCRPVGEAIGRVTEKMYFQVTHVFVPLTNPQPGIQQAEILIGPFILQCIHRVGLCYNCFAIVKKIGAHDVFIFIERSVETSIKNYQARIGLQFQ